MREFTILYYDSEYIVEAKTAEEAVKDLLEDLGFNAYTIKLEDSGWCSATGGYDDTDEVGKVYLKVLGYRR